MPANLEIAPARRVTIGRPLDRGLAAVTIADVDAVTRNHALEVWRRCGGGRTSTTILSAPDGNAKASKSVRAEYILYLSAHRSAGVGNVCPWSTPDCRRNCLALHSGRMPMNNNRRAQSARTVMLREDPAAFLWLWRDGLRRAIAKHGADAWHRPNGGSDIPWERYAAPAEIMADLTAAGLTIADYTKALPAERPSVPGYVLARSAWPTKQTPADVAAWHRSGEYVALVADNPSALIGRPGFADADATDEWMLSPEPVIGVLSAKRGTTPKVYAATDLLAVVAA